MPVSSVRRQSRRLLVSALLTSVPLLVARLDAQQAGPITAEHFTLPNGLDVLLAPDHSTQVAAVDVWYFAGSRDEAPAKAGLARLFGQLFFAGSANVPAGAHAAVIQQGGGRGDASVEEDVSRFYQSVPSNRLNQALWLEADRMRGVVINDTTVRDARLSALQELGDRLNEPYTPQVIETVAALYDSASCPGYTHVPLGRLNTLSGISTKDAADFLNQHYRPNAARLVVTGDFDPVTTRKVITDWFGPIAKAATPAVPACAGTPASGNARRSVTGPAGSRPAAGIFYRVPGHDHPDAPALELLGVILGQGSQARLLTHLAGELGAATGVQAGVLGTRQGPGAFGLFGIAGPGVSADSLATLLAAEAVWASGTGITQADLDRARTVYLATAVSRRERPEDIAEALQHAAYYHGKAEAVNTEVAQVMAVTLADVRRVAAALFAPKNGLTLVIAAGGAS
ncbi:MAG: pitrilysin family protein [Gemmatimonadales bacterium]